MADSSQSFFSRYAPAPSRDKEEPPSTVQETYIPVETGFLLTDSVLPFDLYYLSPENRLEKIIEAGDKTAPQIISQILRGEFKKQCFVMETQKEEYLLFQEKSVDTMLNNSRLPMQLRCRSLYGLSVVLAQEAFEHPNGLTAYRLVEHVERLVKFVFRESPKVLRTLINMGHREYSDAVHSVNVGLYALDIALEHYGKRSNKDFNDMTAGFFLHDIGKTRVRPGILDKPGPLEEPEWWEVKKHPRYGYLMLEREGILSEESREIVLSHHERMDGEGYPDLLEARNIHPYARICAVADAYDALTTKRVFRSKLPPFDALRTMKEEMQTQFDPEIFKTFVLLLRR
ncbi:MAG: HD-GYP domain-containing protein [Candidatus Sumerlaeia bacterium]